MTEFLKVKNIDLSYVKKDLKIRILKGLNLKVAKGSFVAITGASGSGKTSLLRVICGLESPSKGEIELDKNLLCSQEVFIQLRKGI